MNQKIIYVSVGAVIDPEDLNAKPTIFMNRDEVAIPDEPGNETRVGEIFVEACAEVYNTPQDKLFYAIFDAKENFVPTHTSANIS